MGVPKLEQYAKSQSSIRALVDLLRDRGPLYVGPPSIDCLAAFLSGWLHAQGDLIADSEVWDNFLRFVAKKYKDSNHRSWHALIGFYSPNSYEAYQNFFMLFDEALECSDTTQTG